MRVHVDKEKCIGCGLCVETCAAVFTMGDDDKAEVKVAQVPPGQEDPCKEAEKQCPVEAITTED